MSNTFGKFIAVFVFALAFSISARAEIFTAYLSAAQEVPTNASTGTGFARVVLNESAGTITFTLTFTGLTSNQVASHIHAPSAIGANSPVIINFGAVNQPQGTITGTLPITPTQIAQLRAHLGYVNVHTVNFGGGEIRGQLGVARPVDYDGDGRQDLSVLRFPNIAPPGVAQITYYNQNSTSGTSITSFGDANVDFPAPGDYDGDGRGDLALYRDGQTPGSQSVFWVLRSSDNTALSTSWGVDGDQPCARDFDGDGRTDFAIFRRGATAGSQAFFYIRETTTGQQRVEFFGTTGNATGSTGDTPVPGDYDGDGKFDVAVYRFGGLVPNNTLITKRSSDGTVSYTQFGNFTSDYILPGDYDGDGKYEIAAGRTGATAGSPMVWHILQSSTGTVRIQQFGISSDLPVQGDYDGDARTDLAVYRRVTTATNNTFWIFNSLAGTASSQFWGVGGTNGGDFPVATFDAR